MRVAVVQHSFSGHETFPFRYPWLKKGFDAVGEDPHVFLRDDAITTLGVGKNMVRSIRHWCLTAGVLAALRRGVVEGRRLRLRYAAPDREPHDAVVDPVGLVTVRDRAYLLALRDGADRTYRVSRILSVDLLDEPARRPAVTPDGRLRPQHRGRAWPETAARGARGRASPGRDPSS